jgi:hypothetical protein
MSIILNITLKISCFILNVLVTSRCRTKSLCVLAGRYLISKFSKKTKIKNKANFTTEYTEAALHRADISQSDEKKIDHLRN